MSLVNGLSGVSNSPRRFTAASLTSTPFLRLIPVMLGTQTYAYGHSDDQLKHGVAPFLQGVEPKVEPL
jgi:hypothetical protein